jgi:hypothetical protein
VKSVDDKRHMGTGFSASTSVFPCQYHSTNAPYSFIHLPHTLYNVFLQVLQFSPVSIIPLMLHTHLHACFSNQKYKWANPGNISKSNALSKNAKHWSHTFTFLHFRAVIACNNMPVPCEVFVSMVLCRHCNKT